MSLGIYFMSESGGCPKALAAGHLGYEPIASSSSGEIVMKEGKRHEAHIAEDLTAMGYELLDAGPCVKCEKEFGREVSGHHVEYQNVLIRLVGHVDRFLIIDGQKFPCEFKSMGLFVYQKFLKERLAGFPGYEAQEVCYVGVTERPGLYVVKNRDNGQMTLHTVPYGELVIPGHKILPVHITFDDIVDKLNSVEISVRGGELPGCSTPENERRWCPFKYLCTQEVPEEKGVVVAQAELLEAADLWKEGNKMEREGKDKIEYATAVLLAQGIMTPKYTVSGLSVSYGGQKTKKYVDVKTLRELVSEDLVKKVMKESKAYNDLKIREIKED